MVKSPSRFHPGSCNHHAPNIHAGLFRRADSNAHQHLWFKSSDIGLFKFGAAASPPQTEIV
jgi:hypothetical protein